MRNPLACSRTAVAMAVLGLCASSAWSAGFAVQETSASGMGNAYAGGAAIADDASTAVVQRGRHGAAGQSPGGRCGERGAAIDALQQQRVAAGGLHSRWAATAAMPAA